MTGSMRATLASTLLTICLSVAAEAAPGAGAPAGDLNDLQGRWHQCVRDAYAEQPSRQSRAASQLNALDACKEHEDAMVASVMASQVAEDEAARGADRALTVRAKAWASSALAYVLEPVTDWISRPAR
jgi:hypothetical protein